MKVAICGFEGYGLGDLTEREKISSALGENSGNLLFWNAARSMFNDDYDYLVKPGRTWKDPRELNREYDCVVAPLANQLNKNVLSVEFVSYLKAIDIPILVLGLGVQISDIDHRDWIRSDFLSTPHCRDFISILNEKSKVVCVRGGVSGDFLTDLGYRGLIYETGCPSQTLSGNRSLGHLISENLSILKNRIFNSEKINAQVLLHPPMNTDLNWVTEKIKLLLNEHNILYVQQTEGFDKSKMIFDRSCLNNKVFSETAYPEDDGIIFLNLASWASALRSTDFSIGTRIHGNILATQLGIPSILIEHDIRVSELSKKLMIPSLDRNNFNKKYKLIDVFDEIEFDPVLFDINRKENCSLFVDALKILNLDPSEKLLNLADRNNLI